MVVLGVVFIPEVMQMPRLVAILLLQDLLQLAVVEAVDRILLELLAVLAVAVAVEQMHLLNKPQVQAYQVKALLGPQVFKIVEAVAVAAQVRQVA
jgi:hypothetical protein